MSLDSGGSLAATGVRMPRFFFHMKSGRTELSDEKGREFSDLDEAHDHALYLIHRAMTYLSEGDTDGWMINIETAVGTMPLTVLFPRRHFWMQKVPYQSGGYGSRASRSVPKPGVDRGSYP